VSEESSQDWGHDALVRIFERRTQVHDLLERNQYATTPNFSKREFSRFFGATDALWDTFHAITGYWCLEWPSDQAPGHRLLLAWGYLQSLTIMTEAGFVIANLAEKRDPTKNNQCWYEKYPNLGKVREFRNRLGGHPALADQPKRKPSTSAIFAVGGFQKDCWEYAIYADPDENGEHKPFDDKNRSNGPWDVAGNTKLHIEELGKMLREAFDKVEKALNDSAS
jgi:hypothetical protein